MTRFRGCDCLTRFGRKYMNQIRLFGFLVLLSISLSGCYTKFSAANTDYESPANYQDSDQYYSSYDSDYVPPDSLLPQGTTVVNNYYGDRYSPGPYTRYFGTVGYSGWYDPYYYDPYWYPSAYYFGVGLPYYYYGAYGGWPYRYHYPGYNHYYSGGGMAAPVQTPHSWGRVRSSYRSPRDPMTTPSVQSSQWGVSNRSVQQQAAPQSGSQPTSVGGSSGTSTRVVPTYEYRGTWGGRVRSETQSGSQGTNRTSDNGASQRVNVPSGNNSNYRPSERQAPRTFSAPAPSESRGGGASAPRSSGGGWSGGSSGGGGNSGGGGRSSGRGR